MNFFSSLAFFALSHYVIVVLASSSFSSSFGYVGKSRLGKWMGESSDFENVLVIVPELEFDNENKVIVDSILSSDPADTCPDDYRQDWPLILKHVAGEYHHLNLRKDLCIHKMVSFVSCMLNLHVPMSSREFDASTGSVLKATLLEEKNAQFATLFLTQLMAEDAPSAGRIVRALGKINTVKACHDMLKLSEWSLEVCRQLVIIDWHRFLYPQTVDFEPERSAWKSLFYIHWRTMDCECYADRWLLGCMLGMFLRNGILVNGIVQPEDYQYFLSHSDLLKTIRLVSQLPYSIPDSAMIAAFCYY